MDKQAEIDKIMREYAAKNREIEKDHFKNMARIGLGSVLSGASAHPVFNIPYIGTGIGGAMYDLGQGIVEGDKINDLVKRAARGFAIGETAGAIPYVGKLAGKTKAGQAIGEAVEKAGEKFAQSKAYDVLMSEFAPKEALEKNVLLPLARKARMGVNPFVKTGGEVLDNAPNTATEAFKKWSGDNPIVTSEEALEYPFKTGQGVTLEGFHGTKRGDRVGNEFKKERATSGPMAYFSSDEGLAANYAKGKEDTSLADEMMDYWQWFKYRDKDGNLKPLGDAWWDLSFDERRAVANNAPHISFDDEANNIIFDQANNRGVGNYDYALKQYRNNPLKALIDGWLEGGSLYGREDDFLKVLEKAGVNMKNIDYIDPYTDHSKVYDVFLSMKKPLVTDDLPAEVIEQLTKEAPNNPAKYKNYSDIWDKNTKDGVEWVDELKKDLEAGENSHVWTSIPDWVTEELKKSGYDGIIDMGGKGGGQIHKVYIPFEPTQIKSVKNEGTWSLTDPNIYKTFLSGLGAYELAKNKQNNLSK